MAHLPGKMEITRPGQVWCADLTVRRAVLPLEGPLILLTPVRRGLLYPGAVRHWATRKVAAVPSPSSAGRRG